MTDTLNLNADFADAQRLTLASAHDAATTDQAAAPISDIERMARSAVSLLARFNAKPSVKTAVDRTGSEVFEFVTAMSEAQTATNPRERAVALAAVAKELADVFYAGFAAASLLGVTPRQLVEEVLATIDKNDAKTLDTHYVTDQGSIERRR